MLPKASRLSRREFETLLKEGRVRRFPLFSLRAASRPVGRGAAVVVSKKEIPLASRRNSARRRVYAAIRASLPFFPPNTSAAFFLRKECSLVSPSELRSAITEALKTL